MNDDNQYKNIDEINNTSYEIGDVVDTVPPVGEEMSVENENISEADSEEKKEEIVRETIPALRPEDLYGYQPEKEVEVETTPPTTVSETTAPVEVETQINIDEKATVAVDKTKKKINPAILILILIIVGLGAFIYINNLGHQKEINRLKDECSPVSSSDGTKLLDISSTVVQTLYNKVKTNIREDVANFELNDEMKLYLAYRQIPVNKIYNSNCDNFIDGKMVSFTCHERIDFIPKAFREESLMLELKRMFGDNIIINHDDIQLSASCLGGFQYIPERGEYVEGECSSYPTTSFKVEKELIRAESTEKEIILYEMVKYSGAEGKEYPDKFKNGTYKYTFKLDVNYNYIYISKEYVG